MNYNQISQFSYSIMIITNSNQLHDHLYEFMEDKMCFRKLKSMILLHKLKKKIKNSTCFWPIFDFELNEKRSRAELKILQLGSDSSLLLNSRLTILQNWWSSGRLSGQLIWDIIPKIWKIHSKKGEIWIF